MSDDRPAERYELEREIGRGGMGRVYRALDTHLGRIVALKKLPLEVTHDAELRRRLAREARAASALSHPGVATVYEFVEQPDESFIVFEYVEGLTLRERLSQRRFTTEEVLDIGLQLADALATAHDRGIVHRDLKPENIMLTPGPERPGRTKILDFGLAKLRRPVTPAALAGAGAEETGTVTTAAGLLVGTINYMSPEQLEGEPVDARSDLYALGLVLYELATGVNPFVGATATSTIAKILKDEPAPVHQRNPVAPAELDRILRKCLRKRPEERYQSARELLVDLHNLRRELTPATGRAAPVARVAPAVPLAISRGLVRALLGLIQMAYLVMYSAAFYKFAEFLARLETGPAHNMRFLLLISAVCGPAVRVYLLTALSFDYADLGRKFRWLFPGLLALDLAWAASPLVLLPELGGFLIAATAVLAFLPFSQRTLVYSAYASSGGRISSLTPRDSL